MSDILMENSSNISSSESDQSTSFSAEEQVIQQRCRKRQPTGTTLNHPNSLNMLDVEDFINSSCSMTTSERQSDLTTATNNKTNPSYFIRRRSLMRTPVKHRLRRHSSTHRLRQQLKQIK